MLDSGRKRHLFGGALGSAGLSAAAAISAHATAEFIPAAVPTGLFEPQQIHVLAFNSAGDSVNDLAYSKNAVFLPPGNYIGMGITISAYAHATAMHASIWVTDAQTWDSYAAVLTVQWFTVSRPTDVRFTWDIGAASVLDAYVYQLGVGEITPSVTIDSSGSMMLSLLPDETYAFIGGIGLAGIDGGGFVRMTIVPAPGAIMLLGLGMLTARRRRRAS